MDQPVGARRPIKARDTRWAAATAAFLARSGLKPNVISVFSAIFAGLSGACLFMAPRVETKSASFLFVLAALGVQLRLLCNLFDGMVAVEGGFRTKSGEIFNELPDRFADAFVLIGCGYAAQKYSWGPALGWTAAVLAVVTAYVRTLGAAAGAGQCFLGPMAKQHRMAVVTTSALVAAVAVFWFYDAAVILVALVAMVAGMLMTIARRTMWVIRTLEAK
jgi:phosphatidylglycerophosphate synthase